MNLLDAVYGISLLPHFWWHRLITDKYGPKVMEKTGRVPDRFSTSATAVLGKGGERYESPCLWLHAVSVGEAMAARNLAARFLEENPDWELRVSTTTATGRAVAERTWGEGRVFYYPLDVSRMVARAFDSIRPTMVVLMELEIWPNFLAEAARRGVPVVVANARITERSARRLGYIPRIAANMVAAVDRWFAQTEEYAARLAALGVPADRIEVTGSIKYDAVPLAIDAGQGKYYRRLFGCGERFLAEGGEALVVAGSTHPGEEAMVLSAVKTNRTGTGPLRLVLAPRHPERLDAVEREAAAFGRVVRRSRLEEPLPTEERGRCDADIILVDTMGELSRLYAAADLVFVGGTLKPHGGQNFIEPCGLARPTVVGPHLWNFREPAALLGDAGLLRVVRDQQGLADALADLLAHPDRAAAMGERARELLLQQRGATDRMAERLQELAVELRRDRSHHPSW
ncbi:MAG: 3-deoxy-D-manno-octulosonic acid transferase [Planctomycetes bacterium]|nr:3-deoxy-D-manno-octulosonic acid transferase [Planctomycetota bacterium]